MLPYIILAVIWVSIIFGWIIPVIRERKFFEIYMAIGLGIYFSLLVLGIMVWERGAFVSLVYLGYLLFIPGAIFVVSSFITLKHRGKPESGWESTTTFIDSGVYRVVRHPLYLGSAFFMAGLMFLIQSIYSSIFGLIAIFCFWMVSIKEDRYNIQRFGDDYKKYMKKVPMWNFLKGLKRLRD